MPDPYNKLGLLYWHQDERIDKAWILTYTGKQFYHLRPTAEMVCIEDIAHALSNIGRWTGHTKYFYSVAQHSWYCSHIVPPKFALEALMHDASEAYLGDMNRPLKHCTAAGPAYREIEAEVEKVIFEKFGLSYPLSPQVKVADNLMLYTERAQLMNTANVSYEFEKWGVPETQANIRIERWTPKRAERMFLRRFNELNREKNQCQS